MACDATPAPRPVASPQAGKADLVKLAADLKAQFENARGSTVQSASKPSKHALPEFDPC